MPNPAITYVATEVGLCCVTNHGSVTSMNSIFDSNMPDDQKPVPFTAVLSGAENSGSLVPGAPGPDDVQEYFGIRDGLVVVFAYLGPHVPIRGTIPGITPIKA